MKILKADFGQWHILYSPDDGARIASLSYSGKDLLTSEPAIFIQPGSFSGEYETRPVYGYDDCFPTVDPCIYPGGERLCRDHGELCWQPWHTEINGSVWSVPLIAFIRLLTLRELLTFEGERLAWRFEVSSVSSERSVFLHVMHALLPLNDIAGLEILKCRTIYDEITSEETGLKSSAELGEYLLLFIRVLSECFF